MTTQEQRTPLLTMLVEQLTNDTGVVSADLHAMAWGGEGRLVGTDRRAGAVVDLLPATAARALGRRLHLQGASGIDGWALATPPPDEEALVEQARLAAGRRLHRSLGFSLTCPCQDDHPRRALAERVGAYHRRRLAEAQRTALGQAIGARQWAFWPAAGLAAVDRVRSARPSAQPTEARAPRWEGLVQDLADLVLAEAAFGVLESGPRDGPPALAAWAAAGRAAAPLAREAAQALVEPVESLVRRVIAG
ncbi:MAG: hypothetical protein MUE51_01920 [Thermoleophilia bacterium]|nr:hypothetical protein [Thermoleophilia bacterium]